MVWGHMNTRTTIKYFLIGVAFLFATFYVFNIEKAQATNPGNFLIVVNNNQGVTHSPIVQIKMKVSDAGTPEVNGECLNEGNSSIAFNNTGGTHYEYIGFGNCVDGWSIFNWDITGFDGNIQHGLKTIYFQLYTGNGSAWVTRSIVYEEEPEPGPPAPPVAVTSPPPATSQPAAPTKTYVPETPDKPQADIVDVIDEETNSDGQKALANEPVVEGATTQEEDPRTWWGYYLIGIVLILSLICSSFFLGRKTNIFKKQINNG